MEKLRFLIAKEIEWMDHARATGRTVTLGMIQQEMRKWLDPKT